ncbi:putative transcription factor & chromatin remodeling ARID family [Helianthus anomalus]
MKRNVLSLEQLYTKGLKWLLRVTRQYERGLAQDEEDVIENDVIVESCLDVLDLIILHEELVWHKLLYEGSMEDVINWFIPCFLGICKESEMPPTLLNGKPVDLVTLYKNVKEHGGFKKVVQDNAWDKIAIQCGLDYDDDFEAKVAYVRYIELVEWYFEVMNIKREKSGSNKYEAGSSGARRTNS